MLVLNRTVHLHISHLVAHFLLLHPQLIGELINLDLESLSEILERNDHDCDVVHRSLCH